MGFGATEALISFGFVIIPLLIVVLVVLKILRLLDHIMQSQRRMAAALEAMAQSGGKLPPV